MAAVESRSVSSLLEMGNRSLATGHPVRPSAKVRKTDSLMLYH